MAAPIGNQNARKGRVWTEALRRALAGDPKRLERLANALLDKAEEGDLGALKEVGDRLEGKPSVLPALDEDEDADPLNDPNPDV